MRRAPPPSGSAPQMGLEALEVVKKKVSAPPRGPPPPGMTINFKGPRQVERPANNNRGAKDYDDRYDDDRDQDYDRSYQDDDQADYRDRDDEDRYHRDRNSQDRYNSDDDDDRDRYYNDDYDDHYRENQDRGHRDTRHYNDEQNDNRKYHHNNHHNNEQFSNHFSNEADGKDYAPSQHHYQQPPDNNQYVKQKAPPSPEAKAALSSNNNSNTNTNSHNNNCTASSAAVTAPKKTTVFNFQPILKSTYRELRHFVLSPCQPGVIVRCYIERNRSGAKMLAPFYSLCADLEDGTGRELVVCRKVWQSRTSHYVFSLKSEDLWLDRERRSRLYLGKLRAVGHGEYVLYDNGICAAPDADESLLEEIEESSFGTVKSDLGNTNIARKMDRDRTNEAKNTGAKHGEDVCLYRREMAVIKFNAMNRPAPQCVRGLEVCIPTFSPPANLAEAKPTGAASVPPSGPSITSQLVAQPAVFNLEKPFKKIRDMGRQNDLYSKTCLILHERASRYDPLSACLVEFKGRAHMASIKNFQMVVSEPQAQFGVPSPGTHEQMMRADSDKDFVFMMAKTTEDCFNMDFKYPLSLFQSFAIAIARFDAKLSW